MDPGVLTFLLFLFLVFTGMHIGFAIGIAGTVGMFLLDIPIFVLPQRLNEGLSVFPFVAVPLFFLAGELMSQGGVSKRLIDFASIIIGRLTGGLAMVTVAACMFFAGVSGSAIADTAAIGSIMIPAMIVWGYDARFSTALTACAGTIGPIIPPSVPMVIYAVVASTSIGKMLLGGVIPGVLMGLSLMVISYYITKKRHYRGYDKRFTVREFFRSFKDAALALIMPLIIVGGIISGKFTATESAGVAVIYSLILGVFVYKELKWRNIPRIFINVAIATATVMFIVAGAAVFVWAVTYVGLPQRFAQLVSFFGTTKFLVILIINCILFIVGMIIDTTSAIIIFTPLLLPVAKQFGINEIHFGIMMMVNLTIGMVTPPFAVCLFVGCGISRVKIGDLIPDLIRLLPPLLIILLIISYFPEIWIWLPNLLIK